MKQKNKSHIIIYLLSVLIFCSCNPDLDKKTTLTFVGDSMIARWDLQRYFSSFITYNKGISGAGISYIESLAGKMSGKNIVVLIGTNDHSMITNDEDRKLYVRRYIDAINALGADNIYLYDVLPRDFRNDNASLNHAIESFNSEIEALIPDYPSIRYISVYDYFIDKNGHIIEEYFNDGLHLSDHGYTILSNALFNTL